MTNSLWMKPTDALDSNFIGITTLHVSGSLSAHHQEFLAVHRHWYILCSSDDHLLPGAGWNSICKKCSFLILTHLSLNRISFYVDSFCHAYACYTHHFMNNLSGDRMSIMNIKRIRNTQGSLHFTSSKEINWTYLPHHTSVVARFFGASWVPSCSW
jgi:hypothetical protein